jgi:biopolymer transport protein ExbD
MSVLAKRWVSIHDSRPVSGLNVTPLIDVMLVLLILFIITLPIMTHTVKIGLGAGSEGVPPPIIRVDIEYGGAAVVDGQVLDGEALDRFFAAAYARDSRSEVRIFTSDRARYERFAQVVASAQRGGFTRIGMTSLD